MNEIASYYIESILSTVDQESIEELIEELQDSCEEYHADSCSECAVYQCGNEVPDYKQTRWGCDCFKDGKKMRQYIIESYS
jgi:hypothetical protein